METTKREKDCQAWYGFGGYDCHTPCDCPYKETKTVSITVDQELEDAAKAEYLKRFPYPTSDNSKQELECLSKQSGFKQGAVFGAAWKAEQVANDTMEFIDWILKMRYLPDLSGEVWLSDFGPDGHVKPFTTKELYELWQQSKKK